MVVSSLVEYLNVTKLQIDQHSIRFAENATETPESFANVAFHTSHLTLSILTEIGRFVSFNVALITQNVRYFSLNSTTEADLNKSCICSLNVKVWCNLVSFNFHLILNLHIFVCHSFIHSILVDLFFVFNLFSFMNRRLATATTIWTLSSQS